MLNKFVLLKVSLALPLVSILFRSCENSHPKTESVDTTQEIVKRIEENNELMSSAVGFAGTKPDQFEDFEQLERVATKKELLELTDHRNGVVRCYAFWALSHDSTIDLFPIVVKHIDDAEKIRTQFGCIGSSKKVGDFFIEVVTPNYVDLKSKKLDSLTFVRLDSFLIYSHSSLSARSEAIGRAPLTERLYPVVRELVSSKQDPSAVVTLAKFKKRQDTDLIIKSGYQDNYYYTYKAIQEFPDSAFFLFLENNLIQTFADTHYSNDWGELYNAIANYRDNKARDLLQRALRETQNSEVRKYHIDFIFSAIDTYKDAHYDSLLWRLWRDDHEISFSAYNYLSKKDPSRAFELTKKSLQASQDLYKIAALQVDPENDSSETLLGNMLDSVLKKDKEAGLLIMRNAIKESSVHEFPVFANKAATLKDPSLVKPLFERFEIEWNPHVYLAIAEALIHYNDLTINKGIVASKKKNKNLTQGWGGDSLGELLKKNSIK